MMVRSASVISAIALTVGILAGCAATPPALSREASSSLQTGVVAVAESAAAGDNAAALTRLDELQQSLDAALAAGEITAERAADIQTALDTVRADLQPAPSPTPTPEPVPSVTAEPVVPGDGGGGNDSGGDGGGGDDGAGDDSGGNDDNSGPGNNNGNDGNGNSGNGNGKGKDD